MAKKILMIDDESELVATMKQVLEARGYIVFGATLGKEGVVIAKQQQPDLAIIDLMLPDLDGWRVCQQLKKEPALANMRVIMLSGLVDDKPEKNSVELGDAYLSKPFEMKKLLETIRRLLDEPPVAQPDSAAG